jgi:toxin ParE1/3/4
MAARIRRSQRFERDMRTIWRHIAADNPDAADRLLLQVDARLPLYAEHPGIGRSREAFQRGLLSFPVGKYIVFFRRIAGGIEVVRILHGSHRLEDFF